MPILITVLAFVLIFLTFLYIVGIIIPNSSNKVNFQSKVKFKLFKDNICLGEYTLHYTNKKPFTQESLEKFVKENICDFFTKLEIIDYTHYM